MYVKARLILTQVLAVAALTIVVHTWAAILSPILHIPRIPVQPLWPMLMAGAGALSLAILTAKCGKWPRIAVLQSFALLSVYVTTRLGIAPPGVTVFSFAIYAVCMLAPSLLDTAWDYLEMRRWLTLVAIFMGLGLLAAVFVGPLPVMEALFGFAIAAVLSLGFAWETHVEATSRHATTYRKSLWMLMAAGVFFASVVAAGQGMFSIRPLLASLAAAGRDVFVWLLFPAAILVELLVPVGRFLLSLFLGPRRAPAGEGGAAEETLLERARMLAEVDPIYLQILVVLFFIFLLWVLYAALKRQGSLASLATDEREALEVELHLPKLVQGRKRTKPRLLTRPPKNIWEAFAYLEQWGASRLRPRRPEETSTEYLETLQLILPVDAVTTITRAFEGARYGEQDLTPSAWAEAVAAWERMSQRDGGARHR